MRGLLLVLSLVACGRVVPADTGAPGASFPHPADYPDHGSEALADPAACVACHDPGERSGAGPGCASCHAYPHEPSMHQGGAHGPAWLTDAAACADCHGADGARAPAGAESARCTSCHHSFPHAPGFASAHGAAVVLRGGAAACTSCHGPGDPGPGQCASCHSAYPHPPGFAAPSAHGSAAQATCTEGCHAPTGGGGPTCTSCHDLYPHPAGWRRSHLLPVQSRGEQACQDCHRAGTPSGPALPVSCGASCHLGVAP